MSQAGTAVPGIVHRETRRVRTGFIPLVDAAILLVAEEMGFARSEGLSLELVREVSWSNVRDRLAFRQFDAAHLLGAMAVASQIGIGTNPFPVVAPMALGRGGNAITLSTALADAMAALPVPSGEEDAARDAPPALVSARRLATLIRARRASGLPPLVFGVVYPFSSHNYEFRFWLACGGIDPDTDVRMTVVPPPMTADALASGAIDGFCVNAPWNVLAVKAGTGRIVAVKADIWPSAPEKVLGLRPDWAEANGDTVARLLVALDRSARWCDDPANRADLASLLSTPRYLDTDAATMAAILAGDLETGAGRRVLPDYLAFHRHGATLPRRSQALWIYSQMVRWGQVTDTPANRQAAAAAFRPELYRAALGAAVKDLPLADMRVEGADPADRFLDRREFDPEAIESYVAGFAIPADHSVSGHQQTD